MMMTISLAAMNAHKNVFTARNIDRRSFLRTVLIFSFFWIDLIRLDFIGFDIIQI